MKKNYSKILADNRLYQNVHRTFSLARQDLSLIAPNERYDDDL